MKKITIIILIALMAASCREREGTIKWNDCRAKIYVNERDIDNLFKEFTCVYYKTKQGRIMGGQCISIDYDSNGACKAAYIYTKTQDDVCTKENPILARDDMCYPKTKR